ncbi:hypothetical protein HYU94_03210 [Candidatus Daviesbacteria bacterium]|nr:hypothetical protein [Candidatus Daviesbacteria bacterium]
MSFRKELEVCRAVLLEGIAEFHAAQVKSDMNGPLVDIYCLIMGGVGGLMLYPLRRIARKSPEMIIQESEYRIKKFIYS